MTGAGQHRAGPTGTRREGQSDRQQPPERRSVNSKRGFTSRMTASHAS
jgi:hypothetical protein